MSSVDLDDVTEVAHALLELAPASCGKLERAKNSRSVTAPETGWVAARCRISPDGTWFYLNSDLQERVRTAGFNIKPFRQNPVLLRDKDKYIVQKLRATQVRQHADLFRDVLIHSASTRDDIRQRTKRP